MTQEEMKESLGYAESILGKLEYDKLRDFFLKVWNSKSDFIVFGTQRCSILHSIFLPIAFSETSNLNRCITANAFLLYAAEFAKSYKERGKFPNVTLVEDVRIWETNTECILRKFEQLIIEEMNKDQKLSDSDMYYLNRALRMAVKIYVYAMYDSNGGKNVFHRNCIFETKRKDPCEVNEVLQKISELIQQTNEANTNFHFSVKVSESVAIKAENTEKWHMEKWHYRGTKQIVYFSSNVNEENFISAVFAHGFESYNRNGKICLTGVPIWRQLTKIDFDKCCNIMKSVLETSSSLGEFKWIRQLLDLKHDNVLPVKAQFVSFIFSVLSVYAFYKDCGINFNKQHILNNSNAKFIAINFGRFDDVWTDIEELCMNEDLLGNLQRALYSVFDEKSSSLLNVNFRVFHEDEIREINKVFEDIFYQAKVHKDSYDYEISCNRKNLYPNVRGSDVVLLSELLSKISAYQMSKGTAINYYASFACQLALMDSGVITMNFEYDKATDKIECAFKADELSTFVLPRRLHWFIPAFAHVERNLYSIPPDANKLLKEFIEYILNADNNPENEMECEALKCLKEQGNEFVDMLYKCGQRAWYWEFILLSYRDFQEQTQDDVVSYLGFLMHNSKRERYYVNQAKSFIQKKWRQIYD